MEVERWDGLEEIQEPYLCGGLSLYLHVRVQCKHTYLSAVRGM